MPTARRSAAAERDLQDIAYHNVSLHRDDLIGVTYSPDEIELTPGETYYIDVYNAWGITPYLQ